MVKSKDINLSLKEVRPRMSFPIKQWEVYSGSFYLGNIYKRKMKGKKVYQTTILLFTGENKGMGWTGKYPETLIEAKDEFRKAFKNLIKNLLNF